jgi:hypothetical protein
MLDETLRIRIVKTAVVVIHYLDHSVFYVYKNMLGSCFTRSKDDLPMADCADTGETQRDKVEGGDFRQSPDSQLQKGVKCDS